MAKKKTLPLPLLEGLDITEKKHGGNFRSREARQSLKESVAGVRMRVLRYIEARATRGATAEEVEIGLNLRRSTASCRISELKALGWAVDSGLWRPTTSGRKAAVIMETKVAEAGGFTNGETKNTV